MKVLVLLVMAWSGVAAAQATFAVATIRPSSAQVKFENDGETKLVPGTLTMRDVTIETCIKWAYRVQRAQVAGPGLLTSQRYDITAKSDEPATEEQMRVMMRSLLTERFGLAFHTEKRELKSYGLVVAKAGTKMKQATDDEVPLRTNYAMGTTGRALTMAELADFLGGPVEKPVVDKTGLAGRWDFSFDFTKYMADQPKSLDDFLLVLNETLEGELGLKMVPEKDVVEVMVVDAVTKASEN
jgi:uncharacterized protein (TIGR03435 family)